MRKLIQGIVEFRRNVQPDYREKFARLALGQAPDALFIACSDSRVVPNTFASADPGDLFVIRNVGNLVAPAGADGLSRSEASEAAAIEFALAKLNVTDVLFAAIPNAEPCRRCSTAAKPSSRFISGPGCGMAMARSHSSATIRRPTRRWRRITSFPSSMCSRKSRTSKPTR